MCERLGLVRDGRGAGMCGDLVYVELYLPLIFIGFFMRHEVRRQVLFNIPYMFGAIAKMNYDWLIRAQPPTMWFAQ